jgi:hypothetical protein
MYDLLIFDRDLAAEKFVLSFEPHNKSANEVEEHPNSVANDLQQTIEISVQQTASCGPRIVRECQSELYMRLPDYDLSDL